MRRAFVPLNECLKSFTVLIKPPDLFDNKKIHGNRPSYKIKPLNILPVKFKKKVVECSPFCHLLVQKQLDKNIFAKKAKMA